MLHIGCTRFTNETYADNMAYRQKYQVPVIYGSSLKIRATYPYECLIFVAEMNNQTNRIEGIGLIKNRLVFDGKRNIYKNQEYNSYIYKGKYWLSRADLDRYDPDICAVFDNVLFKKKTHMKCRIGISVLSDKLFIRWKTIYSKDTPDAIPCSNKYDFIQLKADIKHIFMRHFECDFG
jgi:hypothetical protein